MSKPKSFPIGEMGAKISFNITVYKCVDKDGTDVDRREKVRSGEEQSDKKTALIARTAMFAALRFRTRHFDY